MGKRRGGLPDDYDEEEFLLFMREEDGRSGDDDYEADELRLFLEEEEDFRGITRGQASQRKMRGSDLFSDSRADVPAYPGSAIAAEAGKRSQRNNGIQNREKALLDQLRALHKESEALLSEMKRERPKNKNSEAYADWEEERTQLEEDLEDLADEIDDLEDEAYDDD